jgi:bifunctional UDP-N-acetylglucosamine pyrophosphorylase/glucosamine-1-phosphate N-acetyltransferase
LGYKHEEVRKFLNPGVKVVLQKRLLGTADAVKCALSALKGFKGTVLILYGDTPLLKKETIQKLLDFHTKNNLAATLLTGKLKKPDGYGRVVRDKFASISGIVEDKDADDFDKSILEINTGIICFDKVKLEQALKKVRPKNKKKEYYLTDTVNIIYKSGLLVDALNLADISEAMGINSRDELATANSIMQERINKEWMLRGVSIVDPRSTFIASGTKIGQDSTIYPFTVIERDVRIGKNCSVGPFVHLREGTRLADSVIAGNFLETVRTTIGTKTLVKHFSYLGDTRIGRSVNIGAGTVTANFDGKDKHRCQIKDNALIGSDTVLVAPVTVGKSAITGAGSAVIKNVCDKNIVVGVPARILKRKRKHG